MAAISGSTVSPLRQALAGAAANDACSLGDLTVLAVQNDPFRIDTPARHRDGQWLAMTADSLGLGDRKIHLRGLHYMVLGQPKPDGKAYANTDEDWNWLSDHAAKAARWLGYIPFEQITDQRNSEPTVRMFNPAPPIPYLTVGIDIDIPDAADLLPRVEVAGFTGVQPYKLVLFGEKSSLADVLVPVADEYGADVYLPTGEISDTLLHRMASVAEEDGRPMVVVCFSDADPAGWQMPISIGRKLQAFKALGYDFEFEVRRACLTPDQVREHGLPSTPLKATERRADRWREAMGIEQTEIDALASLRPDLLHEIAVDALDPFFDHTLARRVTSAWWNWRNEAQAVIDSNLDGEHLGQIRTEAALKLGAMREQIDAINDALRVDVRDFDLPEIVVPTPSTGGTDVALPLVDSRWSFADQCRRLIESKSYTFEVA